MMIEQKALRSGGQVLVDALKIHGVDTAYCVPGESFLAVLDALYGVKDDIRLIVCRQEGGAAHMAEAHGKLTGKPGICFVTRGPGATNAAIGIHTAKQDSTPLIMFVGQVGRDAVGREAWQEIDYRQMYGHVAKWVDQIDDASRIPEYVSRAFHVASSGRPGPVVLALPEDMLTDTVNIIDAPRYRTFGNHPAPDAMTELQSPTSGTMGYGVPAAIAAKLVHPERTVVCFAGDGCFLMNGQEMATAVQYGLNIIFIVVNNGMYGSIRMLITSMSLSARRNLLLHGLLMKIHCH